MAGLEGKVQTLFRGETLRALLLTPCGRWTVGQIAFFAGIGIVIAGLVLAALVSIWVQARLQGGSLHRLEVWQRSALCGASFRYRSRMSDVPFGPFNA